MSQENKFYPEVVDITIDLDNGEIITETNLMKYLSSKMKLDQSMDVDAIIHDTMESWLPSDDMADMFDSPDKTVMLRVGSVLSLGVHNDRTSLMFGFDVEDNTMSIVHHGLIRVTTITILHNDKEILELISEMVSMYVQALLQFPKIDGNNVTTSK